MFAAAVPTLEPGEHGLLFTGHFVCKQKLRRVQAGRRPHGEGASA